MTTRNLYAVLIACFLVLVFVECAHAAPTLKVTPGTECGAAGVGKVRDGARWVIEAREATPQWRVNPKGVWVKCPPTDCPELKAEPWGSGGKCTPPAGAAYKPKMIGGIAMVSEYPRHPLNRKWMKCVAPATPGASAAWAVHREVCK